MSKKRVLSTYKIQKVIETDQIETDQKSMKKNLKCEIVQTQKTHSLLIKDKSREKII